MGLFNIGTVTEIIDDTDDARIYRVRYIDARFNALQEKIMHHGRSARLVLNEAVIVANPKIEGFTCFQLSRAPKQLPTDYQRLFDSLLR